MGTYSGGGEDYKPGNSPRPALRRVRRRYWLLLAAAAAAGIAFQFLNAPAAVADHGPGALASATRDTSAAPALPSETTANFKVAAGDTVATLFARRDLSTTDLAAIMDLHMAAVRLKHILPGDVIHVTYTPDAHIQRLRMEYDDAHSLEVTRQGSSFVARLKEIPITVTDAYAQGVIENSLFDSASRAGLSDATTMELIQLFGWDIDFAHDIQNGDRFSVIYEKLQRQGQTITNGPILAADFDTGHKDYRVVRYTDPAGTTGYYTPDGRSVRKTLMRAPVSYTRISSGFSLHRMHPILGFTRAHQGVDYAAPSGTPIMAAGDGRIVFEGYKGGYGKCIVIDHGGGYSTLYAHMSRFRRGTHYGLHVKQAQVIGYVGMTGLATGPHLHFEVRINGVPRNPRTVKLPSAAPVPTQYLADFHNASANLLAQLTSTDSTRLASAAGTSGTQTAH